MADDLTDRITLQDGGVRFESEDGPFYVPAESIFAAHKLLVDAKAPKFDGPWWVRLLSAFLDPPEEALREHLAWERFRVSAAEDKVRSLEESLMSVQLHHDEVVRRLRGDYRAMREQLSRLTGDMDDDMAARAALGDTDGR